MKRYLDIARKENGFTLLEVLIAVTILAVGILAIATLFDNAYRANFSAKALNTANRIAQQQVERIFTAPVIAASSTTTSTTTVSSITYTVTVKLDKDFAIPGSTVTANKALVTVSWTERERTRQVQLETYF